MSTDRRTLAANARVAAAELEGEVDRLRGAADRNFARSTLGDVLVDLDVKV